MAKKTKLTIVQQIGRVAQMEKAAQLMDEYMAYARRLNCQIVDDSVSCTGAQAKLLDAWWKAKTAEMK